MERPPRDDFSVLVVASDLGVDVRSFLSPAERRSRVAEEAAILAESEQWHDCSEEDFSDLEVLQFLRFQGLDKSGNRILRIVGKYFPATVISVERLKRYVSYKLTSELPEGPFCIMYMHTTVQKEDNNPGMSNLRWIYEELPLDYKERLQVIYFLHPGLRSWLAVATLGRLFLSGEDFRRGSFSGVVTPYGGPFLLKQQLLANLDILALSIYWKIKYVSRLQYLWEDIKKGQVEVPDFVKLHDDVLEHRPLTDYGIEPDPLHLTGVPAMESSFGRYEDKWPSRECMY